jgi:hypothetical protein
VLMYIMILGVEEDENRKNLPNSNWIFCYRPLEI